MKIKGSLFDRSLARINNKSKPAQNEPIKQLPDPPQQPDLFLPQETSIILPGQGLSVPPGVAKGLANEEQVLFQLHRFGWLTARQIGQLVWPDGAQSLQMARRVLRRLASKREVLARTLPNSTPAWVVTARGVTRLHAMGTTDAQRGTDQLRSADSTWLHRWISNQILIAYAPDDARAYSEYEILTYRGPLPLNHTKRGQLPARSWLGKTPDALWTTHKNSVRYLTWVEVERTRKRSSDLHQLCELIVTGLFQPIIEHSVLELDEIHLFYTWDSQRPESAARIYPLIKALIRGVQKKLVERFEIYEGDATGIFASNKLCQVELRLLDIGAGPILRGQTLMWHLNDLMSEGGLDIVRRQLGA